MEGARFCSTFVIFSQDLFTLIMIHQISYSILADKRNISLKTIFLRVLVGSKNFLIMLKWSQQVAFTIHTV